MFSCARYTAGACILRHVVHACVVGLRHFKQPWFLFTQLIFWTFESLAAVVRTGKGCPLKAWQARRTVQGPCFTTVVIAPSSMPSATMMTQCTLHTLLVPHSHPHSSTHWHACACRLLVNDKLTGTLPPEWGAMDKLVTLCVFTSFVRKPPLYCAFNDALWLPERLVFKMHHSHVLMCYTSMQL
jgi:hypothetical protein